MTQALLEAARRKHHLIGLSLLRIVAGATMAFEYLHVYRQRHYLFGPSGVSPAENAPYSLYALSDHPLYFELLFHAGAVLAIFWTLGFHTRLLTPLTTVLWWSLQQVHPGLSDGGHNLIQIVLIYCCFADVGQHWAITAAAPDPVQPTLRSQLLALTHNAAVLAIAVQLSILYTIAGAMKVAGETWRNGTALYYALRPEEFYLPGVSELLWSSREGLTIAAYATMYVQFAFPLLLFLNRYSRRVAIVLMLGFHLGILFVMGLVTFAMFMIAADLCLVSDKEYRAVSIWTASFFKNTWSSLAKIQLRRRRYETT